MNCEYKNYVVYYIDTISMSPEEKEDILINFDISTVPSIVSVKEGRIINLEIGEPSIDRLNEIILELKGEWNEKNIYVNAYFTNSNYS